MVQLKRVENAQPESLADSGGLIAAPAKRDNTSCTPTKLRYQLAGQTRPGREARILSIKHIYV